MAPCLVSDKGLLDLKDFYSKIEKYINRSSLAYRTKSVCKNPYNTSKYLVL